MKVITKMTGLRLLEEITNNNLSCGTMIRYKREDIALMTNPPQPVYEYYKYTAGDKKFHRCDENGKLGSKGQQRFMNYGTLKKEFEVVEIETIEDFNPLTDWYDENPFENLFEDKYIEKLNIPCNFSCTQNGMTKQDREQLDFNFKSIARKIDEIIDDVNRLKKIIK